MDELIKQLDKTKSAAIDFDGTIVRHKFPSLGEPVPGALDTIKELQKNGVRIILWTCRTGKPLQDAVKYCQDNGIVFHGICDNPDQKSWSPGPKVYAGVYVDDAALGCPLIPVYQDRPYVDWALVREYFVARGWIKQGDQNG